MPVTSNATAPVRRPADRGDRTAELLHRAADTTDATERRRLHDEVVLLNRGVAEAVAQRYHARGIDRDDLNQVALEALIKAVQRFDLDRGTDLLSYAVPIVRGELRRHFRDYGWMVRPTRSVQEAQWRIAQAEDRLSQTLEQPPTRAQIMADLDLSAAAYDEATGAAGCFQPSSLDRPVTGDASQRLADVLPDPTAPAQEDECLSRVMLAPLLSSLGRREQRIVHLRYYEERTQAEIGADVGVTQAQVSRLLGDILRNLRTQMGVAVA